MVEYRITFLQTQPSLFKQMTISKKVDKRKHINIEYEERITKLKKLKKYEDLDFLEVGIDDGGLDEDI